MFLAMGPDGFMIGLTTDEMGDLLKGEVLGLEPQEFDAAGAMPAMMICSGPTEEVIQRRMEAEGHSFGSRVEDLRERLDP